MALDNYGGEFTNLLFDERVFERGEVFEEAGDYFVNTIIQLNGLLDLRFLCFLFLYERAVGVIEDFECFYVENGDSDSNESGV